MTAAAESVWAQIEAAFPPVLPEQPVATCDCEECQGIRADFGNLCWNQIPTETVCRQFESLPLLTIGAFGALLPAYMLQALREMNSENEVLDFTLYALCGAYDEREQAAAIADARVRERAAFFTTAQRGAVRAFLALVRAAPELNFHHSAIERALSTVWV